jgi:hypothetical protein
MLTAVFRTTRLSACRNGSGLIPCGRAWKDAAGLGGLYDMVAEPLALLLLESVPDGDGFFKRVFRGLDGLLEGFAELSQNGDDIDAVLHRKGRGELWTDGSGVIRQEDINKAKAVQSRENVLDLIFIPIYTYWISGGLMGIAVATGKWFEYSLIPLSMEIFSAILLIHVIG